MDPSVAFSEAGTQLGEEPRPYLKTMGPQLFSESILTDNTLKQIPTESQKNLLSELLSLASSCSGLLYGFPKSGGFVRKMCSYAEAASSYDFYIRCIVFIWK